MGKIRGMAISNMALRSIGNECAFEILKAVVFRVISSIRIKHLKKKKKFWQDLAKLFDVYQTQTHKHGGIGGDAQRHSNSLTYTTQPRTY